VILTFDGADLQYLVALDKLTGKTVWKTERSVAWNDENVPDPMVRDGDRRKAHSTPIVVKTTDGTLQLLSAGAKAAYGYDPLSGRELWRVNHKAWSAAAAPVYAEGLAFFITGFGGPTELWAVRVIGSGDVTDSHIVWKVDKNVAKMPSPILVDGLLYMVSDEGALSCLEPATGEPVWGARIPGNYAASPVYADGLLYFCNQQGKTTVLKPGRSFEPAATNTLETGLMASPAIADNALFLRTKTHLYRLERNE
jgi:outer membrane protein assembly factor BamB